MKQKTRISVSVPSIELSVIIEAKDGCDALSLSGRVIDHMRKVMQLEPIWKLEGCPEENRP